MTRPNPPAPGAEALRCDITKLLDSVVGDCYLGKDQEEELVAKIRIALSVAHPHPTGWRDISSAPKHTEVLVWRDDAGAFIAKLTTPDAVITAEEMERENLDFPDDFEEWWADAYGWQEGSEKPTHWMPIPAEPNAAHPAEQQEGENIREGQPYDDPYFESLCREHDIWGTAQAALCAVFWVRAKEVDSAGEKDAEITRLRSTIRAIDSLRGPFMSDDDIASVWKLVDAAMQAMKEDGNHG